MHRRRAGLIPVLLTALASGAAAQPAEPAPPDPGMWTMEPDSSRHEASGTVCVNQVLGFAALVFSRPDTTGALGLCSYTDESGAGNAGVRVRRYLPGEGESRQAITDDRALMEPDPVRGAPLFTVRMDGITTPDGIMGGRVTITKVRNGYLIDCFAEAATLDAASAKIARICRN